jgi:hypothetical protein
MLLVQEAAPAGMLTTTEAFELLLDGRAARTSDWFGLAALHTELVQDCDIAGREKTSTHAVRKKVENSFFTVEQLLY